MWGVSTVFPCTLRVLLVTGAVLISGVYFIVFPFQNLLCMRSNDHFTNVLLPLTPISGFPRLPRTLYTLGENLLVRVLAGFTALLQ